MRNKNISTKKNLISRRKFMNRAATGAAAIILTPVTQLHAINLHQTVLWPSDAADYHFYMIGHAHIDPVWLWPWSEGISVVHSTFQSALDRMNETDDFCFTASSSLFYKWVEENDPKMLDKIRERVKEGRWNIIGGWWVEPDVNIPGGEAMARQGLYGQLTLQRLLGQRAKVAFNPDSFGHTSTLPQIIKSQGMENYIFMRPGPHEKSIPSDLFWWEGKDGTRVLTYRIQHSYNASGTVKDRISKIINQNDRQPMKSFMAYYGAGDHGGGATKENIRSINELKSEKGAPKVFYSTPDQYFNDIRKNKQLKLPIVKDDLQHHAVGCYTAESEIKKRNRQSEAALITAEKMAAIGSIAWAANYPKKELTAAWQRVLSLQFHDSLAGTSLYEHSLSARNGYGYALDIAHQSINMTIQKLEWQVPAEDPDSQYLLLFNPHAWKVQGIVEYDFFWRTKDKTSRIEDEQGKSLLHQWAFGSTITGSRKRLAVNVSVPPMGYRQIRLMDGNSLPENKIENNLNENVLENEFIKVQFSNNGAFGIFDKKNKTELFTNDNGCKAIIIDDPSDTWSHSVESFSNEIGSFKNATFNLLEKGSLRTTIRVITTHGNSSLTIDWTLNSGSPNLEAKIELDWHEQLKMLKFSFPTNIKSPVATYETPYGSIERATNGDEDPGQRWIDLSGKQNGNSCGLTIINDAKYGYNIINNDMRISIARAAVYAHHRPKVLDKKEEYLWMDQGIQTFRMLLVPHQGSWQENNIPKIADEFIAPLVSIYQGIHGGLMPKAGSFLNLNSKNVMVTAVKQSEIREDTIIRCVETSGLPTKATLDLRFLNRTWTGSFKAFEIKTIRINKTTGSISEVNLLEELDE